ncbi:hypothetical protein HYPSUDRAFT_78812, partial [Hypholoma sublateritium FD-334 SS-4]
MPKRTADAVDPIALCAFVGDLFSLGALNLCEFEDCVGYLLTLVPSALLVECLCALFAHGGAHPHPEMTPTYLLRCIGSIEKRFASCKGIGRVEETKLTSLIYDIMFRVEGKFVADIVDWKLDLDTAL